MKKIISPITFTAIIAISFNQIACKNNPKDMKGTGINLADIDSTVKPSDNFFQYANGGWIKANPIPGDQTRWGSFSILVENNKKNIRQIADDAAKKTDVKKDSPEQLVGDFYFSAMDTNSIEKQGASPIKADMERIDMIKEMKGVLGMVARMQMWNASPMFSFGAGQDPKNSEVIVPQLEQGGLSLPDRDYYVKTDGRSQNIREEFIKHVSKMFQLYGNTETEGKKYADVVMRIESDLAKASMTRVEKRDPFKTYNKVTVAELDALTPSLKWEDMLNAMQVKGKYDYLVLAQPDFLKELEHQLKSTSLSDWKIYLKWHLLNMASSSLSNDFVMEDFHLAQVMSGQKQIQDRWKRMVQYTDRYLGDALGQLYVSKYFPPEAKKKADELVSNLMAAYQDRIQHLDWMSDDTKKKAIEKLNTIARKIGYSEKWKDYAGLEISRESFFKNILNAKTWNYNYMISKVGQPVNRTEWHMTPPTVNAYYNPSMNEIVFPAGILQPPFFDPNADDAVNYGSIGAVIGHELTHGFDDEGRNYDAKGNLTNWWTSEDSSKFDSKAKMIVDQFNNYKVLDSLHVNGELTLGENIADLGGITIAYAAFKRTEQGKSQDKIDGFTPDQRFFLGFARIWASSIRPEAAAQRLIIDSHSPSQFRVNGPLSNLPEFYAAFNVAENEPMHRGDTLRAKIW